MAEFMNFRKVKVYRVRRDADLEDYFALHRFREESVEWLSQHFLGNDNEKRGGALSSKKRMEIYLRCVADPGHQIGVAEEVGVHRTTVCKTFSFVLSKVCEKAHRWIKFPTTFSEIVASQNTWQEKFRFPSAIGAVDCTHIRIMKPTEHNEEYVNRKGFHSLNVQATCDGKEVFTSVDVQWPGSVHDSRIWKNSEVYNHMNVNCGTTAALLLGDCGYGITPFLMTLIRNPVTAEDRNYNAVHAKERSIIERCFGQLKRRFPILKDTVRIPTRKVPAIVVACIILHNIGKYLNDDLPAEAEETNFEDYQFEENDSDNNTTRGKQRRDQIKSILINNR